MSDSTPTGDARDHSGRKQGGPIAMIAWTVVALAALAGGFWFAGKLTDTIGGVATGVTDAVQGLAAAFRPQINIHTTVRTAVGELSPSLSLKVAERELEVTVEDVRETTWIGVPVGATVTKLRSQGNRVQYIVPLAGVTPEQMEFVGSAAGGALLVHLPSPRVDEQMVFVQVDPQFVQVEVDDQWLNNINPFIEDGADRARASVRSAAVQQASHAAFLREVEAECTPRVEQLFQGVLASSLRDGVQVKIVWDR